jgi:HEAT repeat protein
MMEHRVDERDFFISYNHKDKEAALWIDWQLKNAGYSTFIQARDIKPGNNFVEKMDNALKTCKSTVAVLSENYFQSEFTKPEWQAAFKNDPTGKKRSLIPIRIQACDVKGLLGPIVYIDLVGLKEEEAKKALLQGVGKSGSQDVEKTPFKTFGTEISHVSNIDRENILRERAKYFKEIKEKTIKSNHYMKLKLEQEIEKEVKIKDEETGIIKKRKELVWEEVGLAKILENNYNYLLINPSGMGKTTFLTHVACTLLESNVNYKFLPFSTTCIQLNKRENTIFNFVKNNLESFYYNSQTSLINNEWENLCILIDALDQARDIDDIVSSLYLQNKYGNYKKAKIILSSRQNTADKVREGFNKIRLKLPEADEVRNYLGEEHYKSLKSIIDSSRELITVPVLLEMLKLIVERGHISSEMYSRATLYIEFTRILIDQERTKPRYWQNPPEINDFIKNELDQSLEKIAFFSLANNEILEIGKGQLVECCDSPEKREALLNMGIILELFENRELKMIFRHQSFQAYLAASYIYYRQPEYFDQLINDIAFFYSEVWYEVLRFYVGLEKDPQKVEKMINSIYQKKRKEDDLFCLMRLIFAFLLMSETRVSEKKINELYEQLSTFLIKKKVYLEFVKSNIDKFNTGNKEQRKSVNIILEPLFRANYWYVKKVAAVILGKIGTSKDIPLLNPLLKHNVWPVKFAAREAEYKLKYSKDRPQRVREKKIFVRKAVALGRKWTSKDIHQLILLFENDVWRTRRDAVLVLGEIGTSKDISKLKSLLKDNVSYVRRAAVVVFGEIGTSKDIPMLVHLFEDDVDFVRRAAVSSLSKIGTSKDILLLKSLFEDRNKNVRKAVAEALGKIGTKEEIPQLETLLKDKEWEVRKAAVSALGKIGTLKDIHLLKLLFKEKNKNIWIAAAEAIENIYKRLNPELQLKK